MEEGEEIGEDVVDLVGEEEEDGAVASAVGEGSSSSKAGNLSRWPSSQTLALLRWL